MAKKGYLVRVKKKKNPKKYGDTGVWDLNAKIYLQDGEENVLPVLTGRFVRIKTIWALLKEHLVCFGPTVETL